MTMPELTPTTAPHLPEDAGALLAEFLVDRDANCPICRTNLRGVSAVRCPTCATPIRLTVDDRPPRFGWFLVLLSPFIVTWGYAFLVCIVFIVAEVPPVAAPYIVLGLALADVAIAARLYRHHKVLVEAPLRSQQMRAAIAWGSHVGMAALTAAIAAIAEML